MDASAGVKTRKTFRHLPGKKTKTLDGATTELKRKRKQVLDLAHLLSLRVKMCDQENGSELSKILKAGDDVDDLSASDESEPEEQPCSAPFDPELDVDDDDGEIGAPVPAAGQKAQSSFSLKGGSSGFSSRSHSIFDCLDSVAKLASSALGQDNVIDEVFARPLPPLPSRKTSQPPPSSSTPAKKRGVPDYMVHPDRWTHYSLEDVPETSDRGNSNVAHQFLASLQQKKEPEPDSQGDSSCSTQQKIIFSKPSRLAKEPADQLSAVRGQEKGMRLSHLVEEEDEDAAGMEKKKAVTQRTDECKEESVEKTEERGKDEIKQTRAAIGQPEAEGKEKKHEQKQRGVDEEEEVEEKKEQANPSFASFRKMKQKNYRKTSQQEDN